MLRVALLLVFLAAVFALVWPFIRNRRGASRRKVSVEASPAPEQRRLPNAAEEPRDERALDSKEILRRFHELAFGVPIDKPAEGQEAVWKSTNAALDDMATDARYSPRRPMLLPQLMKAVNDRETSRHEITKIVMQDPALAGSVLTLANSPLYRVSPNPVESIDRALAVLGTDGIRSLVAATVMQPVFRVKGGKFGQFPDAIWEHSTRCGAAAEVHAAIVEDEDPFAAQLLGLLHGLASIIVFRAARDRYEEHPEVTPDAATIAGLIRSRAPDVARRVAEAWGMSERVLSALDDQDPDLPMQSSTPLGRSLRFGRLVAALVMLHTDGRIDELRAKASMTGNGASAEQIKRIWRRMSSASA